MGRTLDLQKGLLPNGQELSCFLTCAERREQNCEGSTRSCTTALVSMCYYRERLAHKMAGCPRHQDPSIPRILC